MNFSGKDAFPELLQEFSENYSDLLGVDEDHLVDLQNTLQQLMKENQRLKEESGDCGALEEHLQRIEVDIKTLEEYMNKTEEYIKNKEQSLEEVRHSIRQTDMQIATLQTTIKELEKECRDKGIDPKDTSNHNEEIIFALQARIEAKKADLQEVDKMKWDLEQQISNKMASLDRHKRSFNKLLIGYDDLNDVKMFRHAEVDHLPSLIRDRFNQLRERHERMRSNAADLKQKMAICTSETAKFEKMEKELRSEEKELKQRKIQLEREIKSEDEVLSRKIDDLKEKLAAYSSKQNKLGSSLKAKEDQLANELKEKEEAEKRLESFKNESEIFLADRMEKLGKRKAEEEAKRDQAIKEFHDYEDKLCKGIDKLSDKMKAKLEKMKKEKK